MATEFKMPVLVAALLPLVLACAGCTTSAYSRERATKAAVLLDEFEKQQKQRIEKLNEEYVKTETRLRQAHLDQLERWSQNDRVEDDRRLADLMLIQWESKTLPSAIVAQFVESKEREIARVNKKRDDVAAAQKVYQSAYQELAVPLKKIHSAKAAMQTLADKDAAGPGRDTLFRLLNELRQYVEQAKKASESADKATKN
jgi:hypothetical protein